VKLLQHLVSALAAVAAGFLVSHLIAALWRGISGHAAPEDTDDLALPTLQVTVFAATVAAATAVAQTLVASKALTAFSHHGH
jgi:hypothetical protein